jgi:hypothetical protein
VSSYLGALINSTILLLTVDHWTTAEVAFPLYIVVLASVEVFLVWAEPGPRYRRYGAKRDAMRTEPTTIT